VTEEAESASGGPVDWAKRLPHLYQLLAGHLIESWTSVHESPVAALQEGIDDCPLEDLRTTLAELDDLRARDLGDDELDRILFYHLRSYYHRPDGDYSTWLEEVAAQLVDSITARESEGESSGHGASS
jgi:hypothetical protein